MTDRTNKTDGAEGTAGERDKSTNTSTRPPSKTGAGQEAAHGKAPDEHDREHQSNYGGGGVNGGVIDGADKA